MKLKYLFLLLFPIFLNGQSENSELIIGKERVEPGIIFIFEGAIKDQIMPVSMHLSEKETNIHIEARVNWDNKDLPEGAPSGGFVPYLHISAKVINEVTGISTFIDLLPHINLIDNFHYARNISLPGKISDLYNVTFHIIGPSLKDIALHKDWLSKYGNFFLKDQSFQYSGLNFEAVAKASRK